MIESLIGFSFDSKSILAIWPSTVDSPSIKTSVTAVDSVLALIAS